MAAGFQSRQISELIKYVESDVAPTCLSYIYIAFSIMQLILQAYILLPPQLPLPRKLVVVWQGVAGPTFWPAWNFSFRNAVQLKIQ